MYKDKESGRLAKQFLEDIKKSNAISDSYKTTLDDLIDTYTDLLARIRIRASLGAAYLAAYSLLPVYYAKHNPRAFCRNAANATALESCDEWLSEQKPSDFAHIVWHCTSQSACTPLDYNTLSIATSLVTAVAVGLVLMTNVHKNKMQFRARGDGILTFYMLYQFIVNSARCFTPAELCGSWQGSAATLICLISCIKKAIEYRHTIANKITTSKTVSCTAAQEPLTPRATATHHCV